MRPLLLALALTFASASARAAEEQTPPPPAPSTPSRAPTPAAQPPAGAAKPPVRVGPTTVTVIDEHESVDDIISRVRRARDERRAKGTTPAATPSDQAPPEDRKGAARLRDGKLGDRPGRERVRERLHRLREPLRERVIRENRIRAARGD